MFCSRWSGRPRLEHHVEPRTWAPDGHKAKKVITSHFVQKFLESTLALGCKTLTEKEMIPTKWNQRDSLHFHKWFPWRTLLWCNVWVCGREIKVVPLTRSVSSVYSPYHSQLQEQSKSKHNLWLYWNLESNEKTWSGFSHSTTSKQKQDIDALLFLSLKSELINLHLHKNFLKKHPHDFPVTTTIINFF